MVVVVNSQSPSSLVFKVTKQKPQLITPAKPTPYEFKDLSDVDNRKDLRALVSWIHFYRSCPNGQDPVQVIKEAIGKALVPYYPLAGRLRENKDGKLVVDCNGEGIMFIEAKADVTLVEFGQEIYPPFPCMEELLYDYSNVGAYLNYPLFVIQVTQLKCGGFIFAHKMNHVVMDGTGLSQFMRMVAALARGVETPTSALPVWERHLLLARKPPQVTYVHPEDDVLEVIVPFIDEVHNSFFFGPNEIDNIRRLLPTQLRSSTTFEILTALIWRSRTIALKFNPNDEVRLRFVVNGRRKFNPPIPTGYYGNVLASAMAISNVNNLTSNPLEYALSLIKSAKAMITEEYIKSFIDFLVIIDRSLFNNGPGNFFVSDVSRVGLDQWDFGWGTAVFGGPIKLWIGESIPGFGSYYLAGKNSVGETGIIVPMCLPRLAVDRFIEELNECLSPSISDQPVTISGTSDKGSSIAFVHGSDATCN